jgi:UDP-N-acetylmuramoylalanine--D-glutamate ligase
VLTAASEAPIDLATLDLASFRDRPVAVLGLARSGVALCRFLVDHGARVTAYDARSAEELADSIARLEGRAVTLALGPAVDPARVLDGQSLVLTSPSVSSRFPTTEPRLRGALAALEAEARIPVVSEVDLFLRLCPATVVGITGTKGKTTTSALAEAILLAGSEPVLLGGNIGVPLVERLPELTVRHRVVLELSELQLPTLSRGTRVAVYTRVTADHIDRHGSVEAYRAVKRRLAELVDPRGRVVLDAEDPVSREFAAASPAAAVLYRRQDPLPGGLGVVDGWIVADRVARLDTGDRTAERATDRRILPLDEIRLLGAHNISNVLAATAVGLLFGIPPAGVRNAVREFRGVEHRLEPVAVVDGVRFVNDSQGTQPDAVIAALLSFEQPLVLIAGGRSKGIPMDRLAPVVAERVSATVLIGESGPELARVLHAAGARRVELAPTLEAAVERADELARGLAGDIPAARPAPPDGAAPDGGAPDGAIESFDEAVVATVLLSPAAASFDMFADYAARGRAFKEAVGRLAERRARGAER